MDSLNKLMAKGVSAMIDIQDILCILEVAKEKSITKAASNLFLTQSENLQNRKRAWYVPL